LKSEFIRVAALVSPTVDEHLPDGVRTILRGQALPELYIEFPIGTFAE
jgi:hypothetical protein